MEDCGLNGGLSDSQENNKENRRVSRAEAKHDDEVGEGLFCTRP